MNNCKGDVVMYLLVKLEFITAQIYTYIKSTIVTVPTILQYSGPVLISLPLFIYLFIYFLLCRLYYSIVAQF